LAQGQPLSSGGGPTPPEGAASPAPLRPSMELSTPGEASEHALLRGGLRLPAGGRWRGSLAVPAVRVVWRDGAEVVAVL